MLRQKTGKDYSSFNEPQLSFQPRLFLRNPHFQTIVSSLWRSSGTALASTAQELILDLPAGVRLQGFYSPQPGGQAKGLVLLLHGWLGQANSSYNLAIGEYLYRHGYSVFRLNLRDHGETHHLNEGVFRGDLLDEVYAAAIQVAGLENERPFFIIGSSLGGNFALRLAWRHSQSPLPNLTHTLAINPPLDPHTTTLRLDHGPAIYLAYFRRKWRKAFRHKQAVFPQLYDFSGTIAAPTCMAMTEAFVPFTPYSTATAYLHSYALTPDMLAGLQTPVTIITASDDPIVPVSDFTGLADLNPWLKLHIQAYGGHVGFIDLFPFRRWIGPAALTVLAGNGFPEVGLRKMGVQ